MTLSVEDQKGLYAVIVLGDGAEAFVTEKWGRMIKTVKEYLWFEGENEEDKSPVWWRDFLNEIEDEDKWLCNDFGRFSFIAEGEDCRLVVYKLSDKILGPVNFDRDDCYIVAMTGDADEAVLACSWKDALDLVRVEYNIGDEDWKHDVKDFNDEKEWTQNGHGRFHYKTEFGDGGFLNIYKVSSRSEIGPCWCRFESF